MQTARDYAFLQTGLLVTQDNEWRLTDEDKQAWTAAIADYGSGDAATWIEPSRESYRPVPEQQFLACWRHTKISTFAKDAGIGPEQVGRFLAGSDIRISTAAKICTVLGLELRERRDGKKGDKK